MAVGEVALAPLTLCLDRSGTEPNLGEALLGGDEVELGMEAESGCSQCLLFVAYCLVLGKIDDACSCN